MNRILFQMRYFTVAPKTQPPSVLNIGCSSDPLHFGEWAHHLDIDDWSHCHRWFTQADAVELPFEDQSFHTVIMGDIIEHLLYPQKSILEAARVCSEDLVLTIFEEWRLPGPGQWIEEAERLSNIESQRLGFEGTEDYQIKNFPDRIGASNKEVPHLLHINQFTDKDVAEMVKQVCNAGFILGEFWKAPEGKFELDDHMMMNWLIAFRRVKNAPHDC